MEIGNKNIYGLLGCMFKTPSGVKIFFPVSGTFKKSLRDQSKQESYHSLLGVLFYSRIDN